MKTKHNLFLALIGLCAPMAAQAAIIDVIGDSAYSTNSFASSNGGVDGGLGTNIRVINGASVTWTKNNEYFVTDKLFIPRGATLTIEPGTKVYFSFENVGNDSDKTNDKVGAITACRGGKLIADGTAAEPIVFTSVREWEALNNVDSPHDPDAVVGPAPTSADAGQWGGIIMLGQAYCSFVNASGVNAGTVQIEGFSPAGSASYDGDTGGIPDATQYGVSTNFPRKDDDNSGVIRYCSIRHGGYEFAAAKEINGLTLGAVGSGTTIEFVEIYANLDDGIEFFGGRVNTNNVVVAFVQDDMLDIDEGYRGVNQFWFGIQNPGAADAGGEWDGVGGESAGYGTILTTTTGDEHHAKPVIYNATFIGAGRTNTLTQLPNTSGGVNWEKGNFALHIEDNFNGEIYDSVFDDFAADLIKYNDSLGAATAYPSRGSNGLSPKFVNNTIGRFGSASLKQIETLTIALTSPATAATADGSLSITVTGAGLTGSPISVPFVTGDTASQVAAKVVTALSANTSITDKYDIYRLSGAVTLTSKLAGASNQDSTLNFAFTTVGGITAVTSSSNTQAAVNSSVTTGSAAADFLTYVTNIANGPAIFTAAAGPSTGSYATYPHIMTTLGAIVGGNSDPNTNPQFTAYSRNASNVLTEINPVPAVGSPLLTSSVTGAGPKKVSYRGAFGPNGNWAAGWTKLSSTGVLTGTAPVLAGVDSDSDGVDDKLEATTALTNLGFSAGTNNLTPTNKFSSLYTSSSIQDLRGTGMMIGPVTGASATVTLPLFKSTGLNAWTPAGNVTGTVDTTAGKSFFRIDLTGNTANP